MLKQFKILLLATLLFILNICKKVQILKKTLIYNSYKTESYIQIPLGSIDNLKFLPITGIKQFGE